MNIIVLMKQVPDTEAEVEIAETNDCLDSEDLKWAINPYDEYALEEALQIKENADEEVKVTVVSVGPDRISEAVRVAYAMGVDDAIHINDEVDEEEYAAVDAYTTSKIIAKLMEDTPYDLIIAGNRAVDDDNYQVPAFVSNMLNIPLVSLVVKQEIKDNSIVCEQSIDGGTAVVKAALPALITAAKGLNEPLYPNFRAIMKAKKKKVDEREIEDIGLSEDDLGINGAKVKIRSLEYPARRAEGIVVNGGSVQEKAVELVRLLKEEARVI